MIDIDFKFRPVGQGAFYSGVFRHDNGKQFSFVYDCGTHSSRQYIDEEIDRFVYETDSKKIDMMIISHFHDDHINKISRLLTQTGGAKYAILPYLTPDELTLARIDAIATGGDPDTLVFLRNPVGFLLERKVEKIILIHPDDEPGTGGNENPDPKVDPDFPDFDFVFNNGLRPHPMNAESKNSSELHYYDTGIISIIRFWEFKFFNKPRNPVLVNGFIQDIKNLLGIPDFNLEDLANYIETNSGRFGPTLNRIYSSNFGARQLINDTSLVVYNGPIVKIANRRIFGDRMLGLFKSTLLTGDIHFDQNCLNEITRKWVYPRYINNVDVFQIPHHGADNYIEPVVVMTYQNVYWWVINFGLGNTHKHPHQNIVDLVETNKAMGKIFTNTQVNAFDYGCLYR